jgi:hypothetical protein
MPEPEVGELAIPELVKKYTFCRQSAGGGPTADWPACDGSKDLGGGTCVRLPSPANCARRLRHHWGPFTSTESARRVVRIKYGREGTP